MVFSATHFALVCSSVVVVFPNASSQAEASRESGIIYPGWQPEKLMEQDFVAALADAIVRRMRRPAHVQCIYVWYSGVWE